MNAEPGWTEVRPFPACAVRSRFTAGESGADRLAIRYFRRPAGRLVAKVRFGPGSEGMPGGVCGGGLLTILDEVMGAASWSIGLPVLTVRLDVTFRRIVPVQAVLLVETRIESVRSRLVSIGGRLLDPAGALCVEGRGDFVRLTPAKLRESFGDRRPR